jgi:NAD(P)-dependent dehydrogenase (short-subunit alcohol dehydrogenase family)
MMIVVGERRTRRSTADHDGHRHDDPGAQMRRTLGAPAGAPPAPPANPLRRHVTPADVADLVAYLASDRARSITGQVLNVCAGELA